MHSQSQNGQQPGRAPSITFNKKLAGDSDCGKHSIVAENETAVSRPVSWYEYLPTSLCPWQEQQL